MDRVGDPDAAELRAGVSGTAEVGDDGRTMPLTSGSRVSPACWETTIPNAEPGRPVRR